MILIGKLLPLKINFGYFCFQQMNLAENILELLYEHDCVIIPDVGALVADYQPAEINYGRKTIYPPGKSLLFNRELKYNDGLLVDSIARRQQIDYEEAKKALDKHVAEVKADIFTGKKYSLDGIGYLYSDTKKLIQFQPELSVNLMLKYWH